MLALLFTLSAAFAAPDLATLCTWTDTAWEQRATLMLPDTDLAFAEAWQDERVHLDGTLGMDPFYRPRFRVTLDGGGLAVAGDIDPNEDVVFSLRAPAVKLGATSVLVPGALFSVAGGTPTGQVLVGPFHWANDEVWLPAQGIVPCEQITVKWQPVPDDDALLAAIGFTGDEPRRALRKGKGVQLHASPDGVWIGNLRPEGYERVLWVAEEQDGWSHVALPHWTGTAWHAWIRSGRLHDVRNEGVEGALGGLLGGAGAAEEIPVRTCASDVPLTAATGGRVEGVGTVRAGTPFQVASEHAGSWSVTFPDGWMSPVEGAELRVPADAAGCPEGTWTRPAYQGLGDLLETAPAP